MPIQAKTLSRPIQRGQGETSATCDALLVAWGRKLRIFSDRAPSKFVLRSKIERRFFII